MNQNFNFKIINNSLLLTPANQTKQGLYLKEKSCDSIKADRKWKVLNSDNNNKNSIN